MSNTNQMVETLENFIIKKAESFNELTSPEEITALAELVRAVNEYPRTIGFTNN